MSATTARLPDAHAPWLRAFRETAREPAAVRAARRAALDAFARAAFPPDPKEDAWRGVDPAAYARAGDPHAPGAADGAALAAGVTLAPECDEVVLLDGRVAHEISTSAIEDVRVFPEGAPLSGPLDARPFLALNAAYFRDAVHVALTPHAARSRPLHLIHVTTGVDGAARFPRVFVDAQERSTATLVETYVSADAARTFTCASTSIRLAQGAALEHVRLQREGDASTHLGHIDVAQGRDTRYASRSFALGAEHARVEIEAVLREEGGECVLDGLFAPRAAQRHDTRTRIVHAAPRCTSRETYKGLLDGAARGTFQGSIVVEPGAQKTDARQTNRNLILSDEALVESTPQLEIRADDVRCTHGSTTGQLDDDAVFYLRQRGLDERAARSLLIHAFARDIVDHVKEPAMLHARLLEDLLARLPDSLVVREAMERAPSRGDAVRRVLERDTKRGGRLRSLGA